MGRSPVCCDKSVRVKKGPWTPEEDIILVSYIQQHGPRNWKDIPTNSGLIRCSKSCRLRWNNYLRPGIKRGNFTQQEDKFIVSLQALLGNRWAVIASYLPQRTDNDVKNYWNIHLKKKLINGVLEIKDDNGGNQTPENRVSLSPRSSHYPNITNTKGQWERRLQTDIEKAKQALSETLALHKPQEPTTLISSSPSPWPLATSSYLTSVENIAKLLPNWMKNNNNNNSNNNNNDDKKKKKNPPSSSSKAIAADDIPTEREANFGLFNHEYSYACARFNSSSSSQQQASLPLPPEKWFLDHDGATHGQDLLMEDISFGEISHGLFEP